MARCRGQTEEKRVRWRCGVVESQMERFCNGNVVEHENDIQFTSHLGYFRAQLYFIYNCLFAYEWVVAGTCNTQNHINAICLFAYSE